jgi:hypothetical protein
MASFANFTDPSTVPFTSTEGGKRTAPWCLWRRAGDDPRIRGEPQDRQEGNLCVLNGEPGTLVEENGKLICVPHRSMDSATAQAVRDRAYQRSVTSTHPDEIERHGQQTNSTRTAHRLRSAGWPG